MTDEPTPEPVPVDPNSEPEQIRPSATGLVVPSDDADAAATDGTGADEPAD
jgi:hypothetical protein